MLGCVAGSHNWKIFTATWSGVGIVPKDSPLAMRIANLLLKPPSLFRWSHLGRQTGDWTGDKKIISLAIWKGNRCFSSGKKWWGVGLWLDAVCYTGKGADRQLWVWVPSVALLSYNAGKHWCLCCGAVVPYPLDFSYQEWKKCYGGTYITLWFKSSGDSGLHLSL